VEIIRDLRLGVFDVLVGINLLREGLDMPEVSLVAILDADKEGFLRSERSLIQTMGRAARHINGKAILYADRITGSMKKAMDETLRRREKQLAYNKEHNITPMGIKSKVLDVMEGAVSYSKKKEQAKLKVAEREAFYGLDLDSMDEKQLRQQLVKMEKQMFEHAKNLEFEAAAAMRDKITQLKKRLFGVPPHDLEPE